MEKVLLTLKTSECKAIMHGEKNSVIKTNCKAGKKFRAYILCEKGKKSPCVIRTSQGRYPANGKVIGECLCEEKEQLDSRNCHYAISEIFVYHNPRELCEFHLPFSYDGNGCIQCSNSCDSLICNRDECKIFKDIYAFHKIPRIWARIVEWEDSGYKKPEGEYIK